MVLTAHPSMIKPEILGERVSDRVSKLNDSLNRLIDEGYLKPGERRPCISIILRDLEEADRVVDSAITKATIELKNYG